MLYTFQVSSHRYFVHALSSVLFSLEIIPRNETCVICRILHSQSFAHSRSTASEIVWQLRHTQFKTMASQTSFTIKIYMCMCYNVRQGSLNFLLLPLADPTPRASFIVRPKKKKSCWHGLMLMFQYYVDCRLCVSFQIYWFSLLFAFLRTLFGIKFNILCACETVWKYFFSCCSCLPFAKIMMLISWGTQIACSMQTIQYVNRLIKTVGNSIERNWSGITFGFWTVFPFSFWANDIHICQRYLIAKWLDILDFSVALVVTLRFIGIQ